MNLIKRFLGEQMGKEVLVVTVDGRAFKGELVEFDEVAIILHEVIETSTKEFKWRHPMIALPKEVSGGLKVGETGHAVIYLKEVMIPLAGILRMWRL